MPLETAGQEQPRAGFQLRQQMVRCSCAAGLETSTAAADALLQVISPVDAHSPHRHLVQRQSLLRESSHHESELGGSIACHQKQGPC